ncbi:MAG: hypothetical protein SXG53_04235 [Pseudomonadota bacterium]|nr:hypothetical protein [Pseudomonadota bacterium]
MVLAVLALAAALLGPVSALAEFTCPRTTGHKALGPPLPKSENWYGSEALAVQLPQTGTWPTTAPGAQISVKLFWWSVGFRPGMESNLNVTIKELSGAPVTAEISTPTNASAASLGGATMLTGIHFPQPGCWEITGQYLGQTLSFVIETVQPAGDAQRAVAADRQ